MSPRIGILGQSTFPSEIDILNPDGSNFVSGSLLQASKDNFAFIHGEETSVPGAWLQGSVQCGNESCIQSWAKQRKECVKCQAEPRRRWRLATEETDPDFHLQKFSKAPAIVVNNDVKHDTNKKRAIH